MRVKTAPFFIRCSSISDIMAYPEKQQMSVGAETYVKKWLASQFFNRRVSFTSKYTDKGLLVEDQSISILEEYFGEFLVKNNCQYRDEWMTGEPDIVTDVITEVKSVWDWSTFPLFATSPDKAHVWQVQGYMALTGKQQARICYVLCDTPPELIAQETKRRMYAENIPLDDEPDVYAECEAAMTYPELSLKERVKLFVVDRDEAAIKQVRDRVELCRAYAAELVKALEKC